MKGREQDSERIPPTLEEIKQKELHRRITAAKINSTARSIGWSNVMMIPESIEDFLAKITNLKG